MKSSEGSCERIFNELVKNGGVAGSHKIEASEKWDYFHAGLCTIHYNPKMNVLDENFIRISLLHEEGHIRLQYRTILFLTLLFIVILLIFFTNIDQHLKLLCSIILTLFSCWLFVLMDEYESDKFASIMLRDKYNISKPSKILEKTLEQMPHSWLSAFTHPSVKKRVKNIVEKVDRNN